MKQKSNKKRKYNAYRVGHLAEIMAGLYLRLKGYKIIKRRYKSPVGEIDLLALKNKTLIAIEVKFRRTKKDQYHTPEHAFETIHTKNKRRITRALEHFLSYNPRYQRLDIRFDAIVIGWPLSIRHLDNAW